MGSDVASIADKYRRQVTMSECYIYKVHNQLTINCVPPARVLAPPRTVTTIHAGVGARGQPPAGILRRATLERD